ncbi:MAG: hypothetical protein K2Y26_00215 [Gemmatimonadaceae bacterium]|nr:hypothetical protein [Gemmatimonadaceae bacterium]
MPKANARNWRAAYVKEVTPGTTPASPMTIIRTTGGGGRLSFTSEESEELHLNETPDFIRTNADGTITLNGEWSYGAVHWLLEALHQNTFASNVLSVGSTLQTFTYEDQFTNITKFLPFKGCVVERLVISCARGKVTWTATLRPMVLPTAYAGATAGTGGPTAAATNPIVSHISGIQLAQEGGSLDLKGVGLTEWSIEWSRPSILYPQQGSLSSADIDQGNLVVRGSFSLYMPDSALLDKVLADTLSSVALTVGGASTLKDAYLFSRVRLIDGGTQPVARNQSVIQQIQFGGTYDPTNTTSKVTRTPAA